ncbi:MAG TPA: hypothetical protein VMU48_16955 [Terracidiphilus sp.]|nr:hypothetical protein [Terracidiphilus sp.]
MARFAHFGRLSLLSAVVAFFVGCHSNQAPAAPNSSNQNSTGDPAAANIAPASADSGTSAAEPSGVPNTGAAPEYASSQQSGDDGGSYYPSSDQGQGYDESGYEQPEYTAPQPPPPLPEYDQPPCPGDDYLWTPGYWAYDPNGGYYWVPGAWVQAPYEGALWTPGYWGYANDQYVFYPGYWGPHIGFYGGIDYGFGYVGFGYEGGYWHDHHFDYNRDVNNVNGSRVHYIYAHPIEHHEHNQVSFNGGRGGIQVRPRPQELAAMREPHARAMTTQRQIAESAKADRQQFAKVNHGRPSQFAATHPVAAEHNVHPVAPQPAHGGAARTAQNRNEAGHTTEPATHMTRPRAPARPAPVKPQAMPEHRTPEQHHATPAPRSPAPSHITAPPEHRATPQHSASQTRATEQRHAPSSSHPEHASPAPRSEPHAQARPESHAEPHGQPHAQPKSEPKKPDEHPH